MGRGASDAGARAFFSVLYTAVDEKGMRGVVHGGGSKESLAPTRIRKRWEVGTKLTVAPSSQMEQRSDFGNARPGPDVSSPWKANAPSFGATGGRSMAKKKLGYGAQPTAKDEEYFALMAKPLRACANYKPMFGRGRKSGLTRDQFRAL
jgi:hypothetical protein